MDPITAVGTGLAVIGSKDILTKMLGPTADYVGGEMKNLMEKCNVNLESIFVRAKNKLGDRLDMEGQVSPRVLKHVLDEGRFCEDSIVADYYGGVLASSKSEVDRDDRGVTILAAIKSSSVYQLRLHYLFYSLVYKIYRGQEMRLGTDQTRMQIYIPHTVYAEAMSFSKEENPGAIMAHSVEGLVRLGLADSQFLYGQPDHLKKHFGGVTEAGMIMAPSVFGAEVFLWNQRIKGATGHELLDDTLQLPPSEISIVDGSHAVRTY